MRYDEVIAPSYEEATIEVKKKYGDRAFIIKKINGSEGGVLGLFKKKFVKLLISIPDDDYLKKTQEDFARLNIQKKESSSKTVTGKELYQLDRSHLLAKDGIKSAINEMKEESLSLSILMEKLNNIEKVIQKNEVGNNDNIHPNLAEIKEILKENEFYDDFINKVIKELTDNLPLAKLDDRTEVHKYVFDFIKGQVNITGGLKFSDNKKKVVVLIGPTGVGKTTTVAKIAANAYKDKVNVEMITIDGFRLGAKYQLERYAEIMGIKLYCAENNLELQKFVTLSTADLIIIDTIGRSQSDNMNIFNMKKILEIRNYEVEYVLTMSANTKPREIKKIFKAFDVFDYENIIITKFDESDSIGAIINSTIDSKKGIMYYTDGQRVPNDIEKADLFNIMSKIRGLQFDLYFSEARY